MVSSGLSKRPARPSLVDDPSSCEGKRLIGRWSGDWRGVALLVDAAVAARYEGCTDSTGLEASRAGIMRWGSPVLPMGCNPSTTLVEVLSLLLLGQGVSAQ